LSRWQQRHWRPTWHGEARANRDPDNVVQIDIAALQRDAENAFSDDISPEQEAAQEPPPSPETPSADSAWPHMADAAYHGLVGDIVNAISPQSEADKVALLIQTLTCSGNVIGRNFYYQVESDRHHANLFSVLVGETSKARKGTSYGRISSVVKLVEQAWADDRTKGGLSSGEGLINEVRDAVSKWNVKDKTVEVVDPGVTDKRLMIIEPEFAGALSVMERHGNTLSPVLRKAWDGNKLSTMTRASPLTATGAHISIIGHITETELRARLTRTDIANGFGNRFLFALVKRSKELPFGGDLTDSQILDLGESLDRALKSLPRDYPKVVMDDARELWSDSYSSLSADKPGLLGAIIARAEAQTVRLAMIYALLDGQVKIGQAHLEAALAVWTYCEASAKRIFGNATGDPVTDDIYQALQSAASEGMTRTAIRDLFGRHQSGDRINASLAELLKKGKARSEQRASGGRPVETWFAL
jgi:hypothetical protein